LVKQLITTLVLLAAARFTGAAEPIATVSFAKDVAPVLVAKCLTCHNAEKAKGRYRLHTVEAMLKPGASKEAPITPGLPMESKLFQLITATNEDDRMPQKDEPLPAAQVATIRAWIQQGAKLDDVDRSASLAVLSPPVHPAAPQAYSATIPITALAFSLSGEVLAASGYHELTVWDARSGTLVRRIGNVAERTFDLAYSPDGRWLACASGTPARFGEVKLFNATNGQLERILTTIADSELCLAFTPDGKRLAAGGADNVIRIWDLESNRSPLVIEQHADWILSLAFSPDGASLASGSRDKSARIFDARSGELDETYTGHNDFVTAVAWADTKSVLSTCRNRIVHRWNIKDMKKTVTLSDWESEPTRLIVANAELFSASMDRVVRQHNLERKELARAFEAHRDAVYSLALHTASRRIASGSHDGEVRLRSIEDGKELLRFIAAPGHTPALSRSK
jgi:WD40 repeat protein